MKLKTLLFAALFVALFAGRVAAQGLTVDIHGPGQRKVNMVMLPARSLNQGSAPAMAKTFEDLVQQNLRFMPFLGLMPVSAVPGGDPSKGVTAEEINFRPLQLARIDLTMTTGWDGNRLEARVYETFSGRRVIGKAYGDLTEAALPDVADRFCSLLMEALTGKKGFFTSPIAFVRRVGAAKEIFTVLPQGRALTQITSLGGFNLGPDWSKDGNQIVFTHLNEERHSLGVWNRKTGEVKLFREGLGNTVISPAFTPEGGVAVTLNKSGSADIYMLDSGFRPKGTIASSGFIDVSPAFDSTGRLMAFTSGRFGGPQIFVLNRDTGEVKRVTFEGNYNTSPSLSPDGRFLVFARQTSNGHRIFLTDLASGQERQISFGPGNDEDPAFGPEGYYVAFASNRSGQYRIYLTTRHGDEPILVPTGPGDATSPAWDTTAGSD